MNCSTSGLPVHHQLPEFTQTHVHRVGDAIQPSHPLSSPSPARIPPSIRVFSRESTLLMMWPKYWSFSFSISPSNEHPGLISFRMACWIHIAYCNGYLLLLTAWHPFCILVTAFKFSLGNRHTFTLCDLLTSYPFLSFQLQLASQNKGISLVNPVKIHILIQVVYTEAWESTYLSSSQGMLLFLRSNSE